MDTNNSHMNDTDQMNANPNNMAMHHGKKKIFKMVFIVLGLLALFLFAETIAVFKSYATIGEGIAPANTIAVTGTGQITAIPDTGEFSFSVVSDATTVTAAQSAAATKTNAIISAVEALGVAAADVQTTDYSSYPTYQYNTVPCVQPLPASSDASGVIA